MMIARHVMTALAAALLVAACGGEDESGAADDTARSRDAAGATGGMANMEGMQGMGGMEGGQGGMMADMQMHMQMMSGMSGDSMHAMLATHRQMMANMIAQMNREMRDMNMAGDEAWTATMDSLRSDLRNMAEMDAGGLRALMPEHHRRAMRLMEMHRQMMAGMQM